MRAVPALAEKLTDPAAQIGELCADALGQIGSREATPALMAAAQGPDAGVRVAALRALARLADPLALPVVLAALDPAHATRCEIACAALSAIAPHLSRSEAEPALPRLGYLLSQEVDRGMRLASARMLTRLASVGARLPNARFVWDTLSDRMAREFDRSVVAGEAVALQKWAGPAQKSAGDVIAVLLPVLDRPDMTGLAYKQALEAIADVGLAGGAFYPYLGLAPLDWDETLSRLIADINKRAAASGSKNDALPVLSAGVIEAFGKGDFSGVVRTLALFAPPLPSAAVPENAGPFVVLDALARRTQKEEAEPARPEEVLLAALLLRDGLVQT